MQTINNPKGRQAGLSDDILWISPDFDEPLEDFADQPITKVESVNDQGQAQPTNNEPRKRRQAGLIKGPAWMSPDFDEPLEEFAEYLS